MVALLLDKRKYLNFHHFQINIWMKHNLKIMQRIFRNCLLIWPFHHLKIIRHVSTVKSLAFFHVKPLFEMEQYFQSPYLTRNDKTLLINHNYLNNWNEYFPHIIFIHWHNHTWEHIVACTLVASSTTHISNKCTK